MFPGSYDLIVTVPGANGVQVDAMGRTRVQVPNVGDVGNVTVNVKPGQQVKLHAVLDAGAKAVLRSAAMAICNWHWGRVLLLWILAPVVFIVVILALAGVGTVVGNNSALGAAINSAIAFAPLAVLLTIFTTAVVVTAKWWRSR